MIMKPAGDVYRRPSHRRQRKKRIADYRLLHQVLAALFDQAHREILAGNFVKAGFFSPYLVKKEYLDIRLDHFFWWNKVGSYRITDCTLAPRWITLNLKSPHISDLFAPDTFILRAAALTCTVDIGEFGVIRSIELLFDEVGTPGFLSDLVRDFPGSGRTSDRVLLYHASRRKPLSDAALLASCREMTAPIRVEV